jgi:hypothetical protein
MRRPSFLSVVPKPVKFWAVVAVGCAVLIGLVVGYRAANPGDALRTMALDGSAALLGGVFVAAWLLGLGYVFADARRRAMRPVLWVLVAALFPHLLGFLLYFVLRQPIASTCTHCGRAISKDQQFCSWCGHSQATSRPGDVPLAVGPC